uniref:Uncharacterized protein n=1 Tax=Romanomermis culicivorax TaxID=13658 RepID=A0A915L3B5_ROMCU
MEQKCREETTHTVTQGSCRQLPPPTFGCRQLSRPNSWPDIDKKYLISWSKMTFFSKIGQKAEILRRCAEIMF